jgi:hypothetical protein
MPISLHALIIRTAISPRLAMRIFDIKKIPLSLDFKKTLQTSILNILISAADYNMLEIIFCYPSLGNIKFNSNLSSLKPLK